MKKLNPNEAPPGYVAVESDGCDGCALLPYLSPDCRAQTIGCSRESRIDGCYVIFIKRQTPTPEPLDARHTIRLPASVKAKAQRIGAAAVIAAIVAAEDVT